MEIKRQSVLFIFLLLYSFYAKSQNIKTYSGKFEGGTATYQYYENEKMDRVLHGSFDYIGSLFNMKGKFINGNKNGKWEIYATNKLFSGWRGSIKLNTKITGEYKNSSLEGSWSYYNSIRFINDNQEDKEISTATFHDNHFVGKVTYQANWPINYSVVGQFDSLGFMTGTWIYTKGVEKDEIRFINGVAYWRLYNNTTNGEKKVFCDSTDFVKKFWSSYNKTLNTSTVNGIIYYPDTVLISSDKRVFDYKESNPFYEDIVESLSITDENEIAKVKYYAEKAIRNVIKITDTWMSIDRSFNPICIWQNESISVYESGSLDNPLYYYSVGSIRPIGMQIVINECDYYSDCYKKLEKRKEELRKKKEEEKRIAEEKARLEKARLEAIARKEKFEAAVKKGNSFFETKKYKQALVEYNSANAIEVSIKVLEKIKVTQNEINRIDSLQKLRLEIYSYLKTYNEIISTEMSNLKLSLENKKKVYGNNYELCMNLLNSKFPSYFLRINTLFTTNKTTGLKVEDSWNELDQDALNLLTKFKEEFKQYEKFHNIVKTAFESENKDKIKLLKSSDNPKEIIDNILVKNEN